jgi:tRNA(Arg) A34 adenosine deaminase TadA
MDDAAFMWRAVEKAREGIAAGQSPFGAAVIKADKVIVAAHNTVWRDTDPTAHAEVNAIRQAATVLGTIDLSGCVMFTTCEPCPMCMSAIHWSRMARCVYGATIDDAAAAGFRELQFAAKDLVCQGKSSVVVHDGVLRAECKELFERFRMAGGKTY